ncbi:JmjC domain-containing protein [Candidatus Pelagadaptatus aseana]|uniref:JmjC domain-containing protein n=1 Tax=Candidatus Pelagadaptatus aseana TaxID=3120508 RepID=UPI003C6FC22A
MTQLTHLGNIPVETFIKDYWQQKPLLIRQAFPDYQSPISADELAGLALEDEIESRIIIEHGKTPWELLRGPFDETVFSQLPKSQWTLLVQSVDQWLPEIAELLDHFRFIPNWRLDDIMISYATDGGSVGPHYDQYDVFLLQAQGKRHWQIGQMCNQQSPCLEGTELHILQEFHRTDDWVLEPGDMLYLPPQLAHLGQAVGDDCMTFSVGFRAPSHADLLTDFMEEQLSELTEDDRFGDAGFDFNPNCGEISEQAIEQVKAILTSKLSDTAAIRQWFGRYMTTPKEPSDGFSELEDLPPLEIQPIPYRRNPQMRFAYSIHGSDQALLFINGEQFSVSPTLARLLGDHSEISGLQLQDLYLNSEDSDLIGFFLENDILYPDV